jgi:acyl-coenzyme A thioesterase PaaI-like protein
MTAPTQLTPGVDQLADAIRELMEATVRAQGGDVAHAADLVRQATAALTDLRQGPWVVGGTDASPYNAVVGRGNPIAAPVQLMSKQPDGVSGTVRFGTPYEGAPGLVHGGVLALVMDQVFGEAGIAAQVAGMTIGLEIRYAAPTPIHTDLALEAHVVAAGDRIVEMAGSIRAGDTTTVTATATFFRLTEEHARRIFPHLSRA